jgi:chromate transporter
MKPTLAQLTGTYGRIAAFTFGGGDPTMAALQTELVRNRGWLRPETYSLAYGLARVTPGTNMLAFTAGSAWALAGWTGAIAAVLATAGPSAVLVVMLSLGYDAIRMHPRAMAAVAGTLAAAVGLMVASAWQLVSGHMRSRDWRMALRALVFAGGALALTQIGVTPVQVIAMAAVGGLLWPRQVQK